jgi:predicted nucleic acid-binding protein
MNYFDTSYLVRPYFEEPGWNDVRELRTDEPWACSLHGRAEALAAFHRKFREKSLHARELAVVIRQFEEDSKRGEFQWLSPDEKSITDLAQIYSRLPGTVFLRTADALHLICARDHGFKTIYSNDRHLLDAARHFGLRGKNVIPA